MVEGWIESLTFWVNGGVVVHGRGFESLILGVNSGECMVEGTSLGFLEVNCGVITIRKISKANQTPRKPSRPPGLFYVFKSDRIGKHADVIGVKYLLCSIHAQYSSYLFSIIHI
jgi:hypothetical protein